jgi:hypothetical protein
MDTATMKSLFRYAIDKVCVCRSAKIALVPIPNNVQKDAIQNFSFFIFLPFQRIDWLRASQFSFQRKAPNLQDKLGTHKKHLTIRINIFRRGVCRVKGF